MNDVLQPVKIAELTAPQLFMLASCSQFESKVTCKVSKWTSCMDL